MTDLDEVKRVLLMRRSQLLAQDARVEEDRRILETDVEPELNEKGQERALASVLAQLDEHCREELDAIERALARIARGEYGRCIACGATIPSARLSAMPTTDHCRPCAERTTPAA
jgi:RNA polymerase-binding transcription factor DksA